ncbi:hypothetical protein KPL76_09180 [Subtercola sp. PAMC28395]|uniref:hypothetical protein n=1 Tax=Subtercola sp. PAMC28395 TaxID=2846775 RepID=UPI001C0AB7F8|nr:hypothetical protein [Subtercola sp. PAMC28395]QWT22954.1 hypothetical protein KPL76_09180 [Subtercola sp. PAMC28395]
MLFVAVDCDEEFVEEQLVEHSADMLGCLPVGVSCVLGNIECDAHEFVGFGEVGVERAEAPGCGGEFGVEAFLFGAEHVDVDGVVVVRFEEFALAAFDGLLGRFELFPLGVGVSAQCLQSVAE